MTGFLHRRTARRTGTALLALTLSTALAGPATAQQVEQGACQYAARIVDTLISGSDSEILANADNFNNAAREAGVRQGKLREEYNQRKAGIDRQLPPDSQTAANREATNKLRSQFVPARQCLASLVSANNAYQIRLQRVSGDINTMADALLKAERGNPSISVAMANQAVERLTVPPPPPEPVIAAAPEPMVRAEQQALIRRPVAGNTVGDHPDVGRGQPVQQQRWESQVVTQVRRRFVDGRFVEDANPPAARPGGQPYDPGMVTARDHYEMITRPGQTPAITNRAAPVHTSAPTRSVEQRMSDFCTVQKQNRRLRRAAGNDLGRNYDAYVWDAFIHDGIDARFNTHQELLEITAADLTERETFTGGHNIDLIAARGTRDPRKVRLVGPQGQTAAWYFVGCTRAHKGEPQRIFLVKEAEVTLWSPAPPGPPGGGQ